MSIQKSIEKTASFSPEGFKYNCPHHYNKQKFTIVLDWFQVNTTWQCSEAQITNEFHNGFIEFGKIRLEILQGNKHFKYQFNAYFETQLIATIQAIPRNPNKGEHQTMLLKLENNILYRDWLMYYTMLKNELNFEVNKFSRIDIAIDGLSVQNLMNDNLKGKLKNVKLIGKSVIRAHDLNRTKKYFYGWTIGTPKGNKLISMYNKTKEINRSNKQYISEFWSLNGLDTTKEINRFEVRLKNGFLSRIYSQNEEQHNQIKEWNKGDKTIKEDIFYNQNMHLYITQLDNPDFLLKLVNLSVKSFLEFVYMDDKNITRCKRVDFLPESTFPMIKVKKQYNGVGYKNKMLIHAAVIDVLKNRIPDSIATEIIEANCDIYDLTTWYSVNIQKWIKKYSIIPKNELKPLYEDTKHNLLNINKISYKTKHYHPINLIE
jgi:hypothetical protein